MRIGAGLALFLAAALPVRAQGGYAAADLFKQAIGLLQAPKPDDAKILQLLEKAAEDTKFADRPAALYWAGVVHRRGGRLDAAAQRFGQAAEAHGPAAGETMIRARCDQSEALLAAGKTAEALAVAAATAKEGKWRDLAYYTLGCALYASNDLVSAGRALVRLAPFEQPSFGGHVRHLLARIHHVAGETTEAVENYEAAAAAHERDAKASGRTVAAEWLFDVHYYSGVILYERKNFVEALVRLTRALEAGPRHARADDARFMQGLCHVQRATYPDAVRAFQSLLDHPRLGTGARTWTARALLRGAEPAVDPAVAHLRKAAGSDPELLLELADALRRAGRPAEAVAVYRPLASGPHAEEARARLVSCLQLSGQAREAEAAFLEFEKSHPRSLLLPEALFHYAEGAFTAARYEEAVRRYERLVSKYPELPQANLCRYRLAMAHHAMGQYAEAAAALGAISEPDRGGPLADSSYVLADALLRAGPTAEKARDAVTASRRLQQLNLAIQALQAFLAARPTGPEVPEAMIKLGYCHQQVAALQAVAEERVKAATAAVQVYEALRAQFPAHPLHGVAQYERANSYILAGDMATGLAKFPRFQAEPFVRHPIAPLAQLRHAQLIRLAGQAAEAAALLAGCRQRHEEELKKDKARASWVPLIRYHQGLALRDAKQPAEAVKVLQSVVQDYPESEWARASKELLQEIKP